MITSKVRKYWKLCSNAVKVLLRTVPRNIDVKPSPCLFKAHEQLLYTSRLAFCSNCTADSDCEVNKIVCETIKVS